MPPARKTQKPQKRLPPPTAPPAGGLGVPPRGYAKCQGAVAILMADFVLEHLRQLYARFDGDLLLPMLLGEIAHHNISPLFTARNSGDRDARGLDWQKVKLGGVALLPCNAFSLSAATGIPRETVRRKIAQLVRLGWVRQDKKGQVFVVEKASQDFVPEFNVVTLNRFLHTARRIEKLLAEAR